MQIKQNVLKIVSKFVGFTEASAHCDLPCGIYDPHRAIVDALTVVRMQDIMAELAGKDHAHSQDFARAVAIKDSHVEDCKNEVRVIWGDYFKGELLEKFPSVHELVHGIMLAGSKAKQSENSDDGKALLSLVNDFAEMYWQSKGVETKRVIAPYKPGLEIVQPVL
jgi:nickel superoxide dismutase